MYNALKTAISKEFRMLVLISQWLIKLLQRIRQTISPHPKNIMSEILCLRCYGIFGHSYSSDYLGNDSGIAYCLVCGKSQENAENGLVDLLNFYFVYKYAKCERIKGCRFAERQA